LDDYNVSETKKKSGVFKKNRRKTGKQTLKHYIKKMNSYNVNLMLIKNFEGLMICLTTESIGWLVDWIRKLVSLECLKKLSDDYADLNRRHLKKDFEYIIELEIIISIKVTLL
jgi:hypothetical protein